MATCDVAPAEAKKANGKEMDTSARVVGTSSIVSSSTSVRLSGEQPCAIDETGAAETDAAGGTVACSTRTRRTAASLAAPPLKCG